MVEEDKEDDSTTKQSDNALTVNVEDAHEEEMTAVPNKVRCAFPRPSNTRTLQTFITRILKLIF